MSVNETKPRSFYDLNILKTVRNFEVVQQWKAKIAQLQNFKQLVDDWDGEGTDAPDHVLVDAAIALANELELNDVVPPTMIHVSVNSTVYFEWHLDNGYCEIEIISPDHAECHLLRNGDGEAEEMVIPLPT
ncbi:MAG: hypothetical protein R3B84_23580 [Zavarzinella sp.]